MSNIEMTATRSLELKHIYAILKVEKEVERSDMGKILTLISEDRLQLSEGEIENIKRYFYHLGLLNSSGDLTNAGRNLIETGKMFVGEIGIYKLYVLEDPVVGYMIIGYEKVDPYDRNEKLEEIGNLKDFENWEKYEGKDFKNKIGDFEERFRVRFIRSEGLPKVVFGLSTQHKLYLENTGGENIYNWRVTLNVSDRNIKVYGKIKIDLPKNMENWFSYFSKEAGGIKVNFDQIEQRFELVNFRKRIRIVEKIEFYDIEDQDNWEIDIAVPLIPETYKDAIRWISFLLLEELKGETTRYITIKDINDLLIDIQERSVISKAFRNWYFSVEEFIEGALKTEAKEVYWRIKACSDLLIDSAI